MVMIGPGETTGRLASNEVPDAEIPPIAFNAVHLAMEYMRASGNDIGIENLEAFHRNEWIEESPDEVLEALGGLDTLVAHAKKMHQAQEAENDGYERIIFSKVSPQLPLLPREYFMPFYAEASQAPENKVSKSNNVTRIATFVEGPLTKKEAARRLLRLHVAQKILPYHNYEPKKERSYKHHLQYMQRIACIAIGVNIRTGKVYQRNFASEISKGYDAKPDHIRGELAELVHTSHIGYFLPQEEIKYQQAILKAGTSQTTT